MVATRRSRASEPLERMATPPKKQRKPRNQSKSQDVPVNTAMPGHLPAPASTRFSILKSGRGETCGSVDVSQAAPKPSRVAARHEKRSRGETACARQMSGSRTERRKIITLQVGLSTKSRGGCPNPGPKTSVVQSVSPFAPCTPIPSQKTPDLTSISDPASELKRKHIDIAVDEPQSQQEFSYASPSRKQRKIMSGDEDGLFMFRDLKPPSKDDLDDDADPVRYRIGSRSAPSKLSRNQKIRADLKASLQKKRDIRGSHTSTPTRPPPQARQSNAGHTPAARRYVPDKENTPLRQADHDYEKPIPSSASPTDSEELPKGGLFGSLTRAGGRVFSAFAKAFTSPSKKEFSPSPEPVQHVQSENRKRSHREMSSRTDASYKQIRPNAARLTESNLQQVPADEIEEPESDTETEMARRAYVEKHGPVNPRYDHLHRTPQPGYTRETLPYPPRRTDTSQQRSVPSDATGRRFKQRHEQQAADAATRDNEDLPRTAPLFGPDSHQLRKTVPPPVRHGHDLSDEEGEEEQEVNQATAEGTPTRSRGFQPYSVDEEEEANGSDEDSDNPFAKRRRLDTVPQTPKSALRAPGSSNKSQSRARFNNNPVSSVRKMSPIFGQSRAGQYMVSPDNLFHTFEESRNMQQPQGTNETLSTTSPTISPRTQANTLMNRRPAHPGDQLAQFVNELLESFGSGQIEWSSDDPKYFPSVNHTSPSKFVVLDLDQAELFEDFTDEEGRFLYEKIYGAEALPPRAPQSPRPAHAELPKSNNVQYTSDSETEAANLEKARSGANKHKPRAPSRLAHSTSLLSRSPSPEDHNVPDLDSAGDSDRQSNSAQTPSPTLPSQPTWTWSDETNEFICSSPAYPDFAYNRENELVPSFCLRTSSGEYDNHIVGPDQMTEAGRQHYYMKEKYNEAWADEYFKWDKPQTWEESGASSTTVMKLIERFERANPEIAAASYARMQQEWDAHGRAIEQAQREGKELIAVYPDRDLIEMDED